MHAHVHACVCVCICTICTACVLAYCRPTCASWTRSSRAAPGWAPSAWTWPTAIARPSSPRSRRCVHPACALRVHCMRRCSVHTACAPRVKCVCPACILHVLHVHCVYGSVNMCTCSVYGTCTACTLHATHLHCMSGAWPPPDAHDHRGQRGAHVPSKYSICGLRLILATEKMVHL